MRWSAGTVSRTGSGMPGGPDLFRNIPLDILGLLLSVRAGTHPEIASVLPAMPEESLQKKFVGFHGISLLPGSIAFIRSLVLFSGRNGKKIEESTVPDYGCGWGRLLQLMMKLRSGIPGSSVLIQNPSYSKSAERT